MSKKNFKYALFEAIKQSAEMLGTKDFVIAGNVGSYGPAAATYSGLPNIDLVEIFGPKRVINYNAIDEIWQTGVVIGSALMGCRGINIHDAGMANAYIMQLITQHAGKLHHMTGGQATIPAVFVLKVYDKRPGSGGQHSDYEDDTWWAHTPGIKTVVPSTVYDAKGLMISAIKSMDPVVFLKCGDIESQSADVPDEPFTVPIGKAAIRTEGKDITIVSSGSGMLDALKGTALLQKEGISVETIDLRTLHPMDRETLIKSVKKTGRLLTVDRSKFTLCPGAEVLATCCQGVPGAKFKRIAHPDAPPACAFEMCEWAYPSEKNVYDAAKMLLKM